MRPGGRLPGQIKLSRGKNRMNHAKERQYAADGGAQGSQLRFVINQKGQQAAPEKSGQNKAVRQQIQRLIQLL